MQSGCRKNFKIPMAIMDYGHAPTHCADGDVAGRLAGLKQRQEDIFFRSARGTVIKFPVDSRVRHGVVQVLCCLGTLLLARAGVRLRGMHHPAVGRCGVHKRCCLKSGG